MTFPNVDCDYKFRCKSRLFSLWVNFSLWESTHPTEKPTLPGVGVHRELTQCDGKSTFRGWPPLERWGNPSFKPEATSLGESSFCDYRFGPRPVKTNFYFLTNSIAKVYNGNSKTTEYKFKKQELNTIKITRTRTQTL